MFLRRPDNWIAHPVRSYAKIQGCPTIRPSASGVEAIRAKFARLGWFVREPVRPGYGVDLFVETATDAPTGRLLALQVKSGASYIGEGEGDITFRTDQKHIDYWKRHSLPVIVLLYDPTSASSALVWWWT